MHIPEHKETEYINKKAKRVERFLEYKELLLDEIVQTKKIEMERETAEDENEARTELKEFIGSWEKEFDLVNQDPEECSDFDSDNEINPLDTLDSLGRYMSSKSSIISSDNQMKRKPIQFSIVGKPNVGKSTLVNNLLQEDRVIANDLAGTTRDAVRV